MSYYNLPELNDINDELLDSTNGSFIAWCGRAATALFWAYRLAATWKGAASPEVIMPAILCATPANTALLAGLAPRFSDVDKNTGLMNLENIKKCFTKQTCAVVYVHLFGQTDNIRPLYDWCKQNRILLIEDNAQSLSGLLPDGTPVGSSSDMSVYSFNATKILESGGGALVVRDPDFKSLLVDIVSQSYEDMDIPSIRRTLLAGCYRDLHFSLVKLMRLRLVNDISQFFLNIRAQFDSLYIRPMQSPAKLAKEWQGLRQTIENRYLKATCYAENLKSGPWRLINGWQKSGVCWRYSLLYDFPDDLIRLCDTGRSNGYHVSNLYWPLNYFFNPSDKCPHADFFARRIVNLWVDESVDIKWINKCCDALHASAEKQSCG